jgi:hypothetical protein
MARGKTSRVSRRNFLRDGTAISTTAITLPIALMPIENLCSLDSVALHGTQNWP